MALRFHLNGREQVENCVPPTATLLDYLRLHARLTGTKEGCAEGDCGACTVVLAHPRGDGGTDYRAVNSCLMLLPQVDGCDVLTVEGLAARDGSLHSVQQALVEADATQCGFCTPGFVMAMFAFAHAGEERTEQAIHEALAGNLCRCTGYRPIVEACRRMRAEPPGCAETSGPPGAREPAPEYRAGAQLYLAPRSIDDLARMRADHPDAIILAGGTDLGLRVSKEREAFPAVISTARIAAMRAVSETAGALVVGGAATYSDALPHLDRHFPSFAALVRRIGSRQIRNLGTIAGNLANASPIGDTIPCLIALDATIMLRSVNGTRSLPAEDFITGYRKTALRADEFIEAVRIPLPPEGTGFTAYKLSKRFDQDISTVVAAFRLRIESGIVKDIRAAYGGMAAQAKRATQLEAALIGKAWTQDSLQDIEAALARDFQPLSDHRGPESYRRRAAANLVRRLQLETTSGGCMQVWAL